MIYGFFIATLPQLFPDRAPELTVAEFDRLAAAELSAKAFRRLISWDDPESAGQPEVYRLMRRFDSFLAWRIALYRAERLGAASDFEIPPEFYGEVDFAMPAAIGARDAAERETAVDKMRWQKIDDLEATHELDFTFLCCYRLRLLMLEKFARREENDGGKVFEESVNKIAGAGIDL